MSRGKKNSFLRSARTIGWAFLGLRKRSGHEDDLSRIEPVHVIVTGLLGGALFVLILILVVSWVTA